jgi:hypothetical protein
VNIAGNTVCVRLVEGKPYINMILRSGVKVPRAGGAVRLCRANTPRVLFFFFF